MSCLVRTKNSITAIKFSMYVCIFMFVYFHVPYKILKIQALNFVSDKSWRFTFEKGRDFFRGTTSRYWNELNISYNAYT